MTNPIFPELRAEEWQESRDTLTSYAQVVGKIRRAMTPERKHWWHASLRVAVSGLTTTPIACKDLTFSVLLNLVGHKVRIVTSHGQARTIPLSGQSVRAFKDELLAALNELGIEAHIDEEPYNNDSSRVYDREIIGRYWQALTQIDITFKDFQHSMRRETSPVQLWPHHFDLAFNWFSGRLIPGQDPANADWSAEQMNFGFSPGDDAIVEPYFYVTAYPTPDDFTGSQLPGQAFWQTEGWTGAVMPYASVAESDDGTALLNEFLSITHAAGAALMQDGESWLAPEPNAAERERHVYS